MPDVNRYVWGRGWVSSSLEELLRGKGTVATTVFVHGNDTNDEFALRAGSGLFSELLGNPIRPAPPTRFVIWSWPNEPTTLRVRKIAQNNAGRVNVEGYYLAVFLRHITPQMPTGIVGYSSGAGVVTGALHVLGNGTLAGRRLPSSPERPGIVHAVLLGAAMPNDWLLPGRLHDRAPSQVERLVITVNAADSVLRWYPMLWGKGGPDAAGRDRHPECRNVGNRAGESRATERARRFVQPPQLAVLRRLSASRIPVAARSFLAAGFEPGQCRGTPTIRSRPL